MDVREVAKSDLYKMHHMSPGPKYVLPPTVGDNYRDVTIKRSPAYSLGRRFQNLHEKKQYTPSPIVYNCSDMRRDGQMKLKGGILGYKIQGVTVVTPSSHVYSPDFKKMSTYRTPPAFSLGKKYREPKMQKLIPGANSYMIPSNIGKEVPFLKSAPSYSILSQHKPPAKSFYVPPANNYNPVPCDIFKKKSPEYSVLGRMQDTKHRPLIPAANSYFPTMIDKKNSPNFCFGVKGSRTIPPFELDDGKEKIDIQPDDL